jgi:hypothetical protein
MGLSIEVMSIIGLIAGISILMVSYYRLLRRLKQTIQMSAELFFTNQALEQSMGIEVSEEITDIHKENFIKFLSDSRDWAFDYIEEVQKGLSDFIEEVEPHIEYYNAYGAAVEGMVSPHDKALKKISQEFEKLKSLLPEDKANGR